MLFELGCCSPAVDCVEVMATLPKPDIILKTHPEKACSNCGRGCGRTKLHPQLTFYFSRNFWCD